MASVPGAYSGSYHPGLSTPQGSAIQGMVAYGQVGILHAIVSKLAAETASATWCLQRKSTRPGADPVEVMRHAALDLLNMPNKFYTRFDLIETLQQHIDLTGEGFLIVGRSPMSTLPLELWACRPDRMEPVPDKQEYIVGWIYWGPQGERIPLGIDEVIQIKLPNPLDPYRGMGPVQSILTQLDSVRYTAQWNLNFFKNSAEPGGVIEVPKRLSRVEFDEMKDRWGSQHQGVSRAHRVAILENARWVERKYTQRDMQFVELLKVGNEEIRTAFAFPRPMLGTVDDTNRANMEAAQDILAQSCIVPRLSRIQNALNTKLLPLFGVTDVEFVFHSPVRGDEAQENAERASKASAFKTYIDAGVDPVSAAEVCELPTMNMAPKQEPPVAPPPLLPAARARDTHTHRLRAAGESLDDEDLPSIEYVQVAWEAALAGLLTSWSGVLSSWYGALIEQVTALGGQTAGYSGLQLSSLQGTELLNAVMADLAQGAARGVVQEAADQGVTIAAGIPNLDSLRIRAQVTTELLARDYAISAGREALRVNGNIEAIREHLDNLTTSRLDTYLGHSLTQAQHSGRLATFAQPTDGPIPAYYADEILDQSTCEYCREVHGRWLGNSLAAGGEVLKMYPTGGYTSCLGRQRCRGQVVCVWRGNGGRPWIEKEPI